MEKPELIPSLSSALVLVNHNSSDGILPILASPPKRRYQNWLMENERDLLKNLRLLDPKAITEIHNRFFADMYRYAYYRVGDESRAEDIASEAFTRMLEAFNSNKGPRSSIRGWLMGTVSNIVNDYFRMVYGQQISELSDFIQDPNNLPDSSVEIADQNLFVRSALRELTSDQQHVLALRFGSECSLAETANIMGKKPNAIKQLQFRALAALRRHLGENFDV